MIPGDLKIFKYTLRITLLISLLPVIFQPAAAQERALTFFVVSDTHYGASETIAGANRETIDIMKKLPGTPLPEKQGKGVVGIPAGVIHCGDILDNADKDPASWDTFRADYGLSGEGRISYPVYETFGNHDGGIQGPVRQGILARNKTRPAVTSISANGLHYSWDWDDIHFVNVNLYPANEWDSTCEWCHYFHDDFKYPLNSLDFLRADLEEKVGASGRPVIIIQHYGWDEFSKLWWTEDEKEAYYQVVRDYNIAAVFQGHSHGVEHFQWKGIDIWSAGSGQRDPDPGNFLVVSISDEKMYISERNENGWGLVFSKDINR